MKDKRIESLYQEVKELLPEDFNPVQEDLELYTKALLKVVDDHYNRKRSLPSPPTFLNRKQ